MFLGSYKPSFDKLTRRVALPKKIRDYLATSQIILTFGLEPCIFGFDQKFWQRESQKQLEQSLSLRPARDLRRLFFSGARLITLDYQGRFVIPGDLLEYAQIKNPIIIGAGDHFEIWDRLRWQGYQKHLKEATKG